MATPPFWIPGFKSKLEAVALREHTDAQEHTGGHIRPATMLAGLTFKSIVVAFETSGNIMLVDLRASLCFSFFGCQLFPSLANATPPGEAWPLLRYSPIFHGLGDPRLIPAAG